MKRLVAVAVALAVGMVIPATAHAMKPEQFKFEGETALAFWFEGGEGSVKFTDAILNVGTTTVGGDTFESATFDLFIGEFGDDTFLDLFGFAELEPGDFELDAAGGSFSASVDVDIELAGQECTFGPSPFPDCVPLGPFFVTVAIEWDETTGRLFPSIVTGTQSSPFFFSKFRQRSHVRPTSATGTIGGDLVMDLGTTDDAAIGRDTFADRFRFVGG